MIQPKSPKDGQWKKNERSKLQSHPEATFDILMAKYREDRASMRERKNWTIQFPKPVHPISLDQNSTSMAGSRSSKRSKTPPWQNSEGWDIIVRGSVI
jgi:hypothetical protein